MDLENGKAIYLVNLLSHGSGDLAGIEFQPTDTSKQRKEKVAEIKSRRDKNARQQELQKYIFTNNITTVMPQLLITGLNLLWLTGQEALQLEKDLQPLRVEVGIDFELNLIDRPTLDKKRRPIAAMSEPDLWHLGSNGISLLEARNGGFTGRGEGITVAFIDDGVYASHPDFTIGGRNKVTKAFVFNGNGLVSRTPTDSSIAGGHGTKVAGLICGNRVGVAPSANVVCIRVGGGSIWASNFGSALEELLLDNSEVQIINASLGRRGHNPGLRESLSNILRLNILPIFAIGNDGAAISPGNYDEQLSIGATNRAGSIPNFSSREPPTGVNGELYAGPDLVAPGEGVFSLSGNSGYVSDSGTSLAAPIISGTAALIKERFPALNATQISNKLLCAGVPLSPPDPEAGGRGLLNLPQALSSMC